MVEINSESEDKDNRETEYEKNEDETELIEDYIELDLHDPSVILINEDSSKESLNWNMMKKKVDTYQNNLKKGKYAVDTLYYYLIDYSGFHESAKFFDLLLRTEDISNVITVTEEEKILKSLTTRIFDAITMHRRNNLSEVDHLFRNIVPLLDATIGRDNHYWVKYGKASLEATANRRNKGTDPNDRARIGYKVDVIFEYRGISWTPAIGCIEVSGGLTRCSRSKEWDDTRKLGLEH
ncbi:hypothetical protein C1646_771024 [Rhizophagus diaphanus]|nr:hypothetical protein C1646_771024 [Rhizophagus diaphanus] [Rhizophagus sp. MUCL 43196]